MVDGMRVVESGGLNLRGQANEQRESRLTRPDGTVGLADHGPGKSATLAACGL